MLLVGRVGHGIKEQLEDGQAADLLGWATPSAFHE